MTSIAGESMVRKTFWAPSSPGNIIIINTSSITVHHHHHDVNSIGLNYRSYYRCTHRSTQNCWATKQVQRSDSDSTVFEVTYRGTHTCSRATAAAPHPPASPEKQDTITKPPIAQKPNDLLESLKTSLTVRTEGLDEGEDVFSLFPNTPPFYDYGTPNDYFGGLMESSPIFDVVDWFNPTVEINPEFPTFLPDSIYY